jgi:hypothetical protein
MSRQEKYDNILRMFTPTNYPNVTVVTMKNGEKFYGYFDLGGFPNDRAVADAHKIYFVPTDNAREFQQYFEREQKKNANLCTLLDVDEIQSIVYQTPHGEIEKEFNFN